MHADGRSISSPTIPDHPDRSSSSGTAGTIEVSASVPGSTGRASDREARRRSCGSRLSADRSELGQHILQEHDDVIDSKLISTPRWVPMLALSFVVALAVDVLSLR